MKEQATEAAKVLLSMRRKVQGHCAVCGKPFEGLSKRRYCSNTCNQRAFQARLKAKKGA